MIWLLYFVMAALASPFKSKIRLEAENAINPEGPHGHPSRDAGPVASGRLSQLLALEVTIIGRAAADRDGPSRTDPADERRKLTVDARRAPKRVFDAHLPDQCAKVRHDLR